MRVTVADNPALFYGGGGLAKVIIEVANEGALNHCLYVVTWAVASQ